MAFSQQEKGARFQALHREPGAFFIGNAWDGGSARVLQGLGFKAIATSSGAAAYALGRLDGGITRDEALAHARLVAASTDLPVSADLERGFADAPRDVAQTIALAAQTGIVGCSIEDFSGDPQRPIYDIGLATERIAAAAEAARALPFAFTLTARTENHLHGVDDLADTIRRLQAYERAGADVLFAPALPSLAAVKEVCASLSRPLNFMVAIPGKSFTAAELTAAGVKRISLATTLYRAAMGGLAQAGREVLEHGTFGYLQTAMSGGELHVYLKRQG